MACSTPKRDSQTKEEHQMIERSLEERNKLIEANIKMVWHIAKKLESYAKRQGFAGDLDDLASIGTLGLIKAATNYDESRGNKFSTVAYVYIRNKIIEQVRHNGLIRLPPYTRGKLLEQYKKRFKNRPEKWREKIQAAKRAYRVFSLSDIRIRPGGYSDELIGNYEDSDCIELKSPEAEDPLVLAEIYENVLALKETYRTPILKHFWDHQGQKDIAEELGLTRQRIHKRIKSGIKKLQELYCVGEREND